MKKLIFILITLFVAQSQANFGKAIAQIFEGPNTCYNAEFKAKLNQVLNSQNDESNVWHYKRKDNGKFYKEQDPRKWYTKNNPDGLRVLCESARNTRFVKRNRLVTSSQLAYTRKCGESVLTCHVTNKDSEREDGTNSQSNSPDTDTPSNGGNDQDDNTDDNTQDDNTDDNNDDNTQDDNTQDDNTDDRPDGNDVDDNF